MISEKKKFIFFRIPKSAGKSLDFALSHQYINLPVEYTCSDSGNKDFKKQLFSKHLSFFHFRISFDDAWFTINGKKTIQKKLDSVDFHNVVKDSAIQDYYKFCFVRNPWDRVVSNFVGRCNRAHKRKQFKTDNQIRKQFTRFILNEGVEATKLSLQEKLEENKWPNSTKRGKRYSDFGQYALFSMQQIQYMTDDMTPTGKNMMDYVGRFENIKAEIKKISSSKNIEFAMPSTKIGSYKKNHYSYYYNTETKQIVSELFADDIRIFNYSFEDRT